MTTATITPLPDGRARLSFKGVDETFENLPAALDEARKHTFPFTVLPFPQLSPAVLAVSPALKS